MGIQGFTPSSGGLPGKSYIGNVALTSSVISWTQAGGPGKYTILSQTGKAGYVYFIGSSTFGGPMNGVIDVTSAFSTIKIVGEQGDIVTLFKVATKSTTAITPTMTTTTWTSSQNGITLPTNQTGFIDAFLVGGGGGGSHGHHGGGAGGGGCVLVNSFPMTPGSTFNVTIGTHGTAGNAASNGGDTIFNGIKALGGGFGAVSHGDIGGNGGCGGSASGHAPHGGMDVGATPGRSMQKPGVGSLIDPKMNTSNWLTTTTISTHGYDGATAGPANSHGGPGGGGAGGGPNGSFGLNGGDGFLLPWNSTYYGAGGNGVFHSSNRGLGSAGAGWGNPGSGARPTSMDNGSRQNGTAGVVIVRSYSI